MNEIYFKDFTKLMENAISSNNLHITSKLGSGNYGQVYKGNSQPTTLAKALISIMNTVKLRFHTTEM